jgi:seryl-tRNA synthetase
MLDLNFVRDNIPRIEQMLRDRGLNPDAVLKDFRTVDAQRRQAIQSAETVRAERNRLSAEIPKLQKSGQDASQLIADAKDMRVQIQELEKAAEEYDTRMSEVRGRHSQRTARFRAGGKISGRERGSATLGHSAKV